MRKGLCGHHSFIGLSEVRADSVVHNRYNNRKKEMIENLLTDWSVNSKIVLINSRYQNDDIFLSMIMQVLNKFREPVIRNFIISKVFLVFHIVNISDLCILRLAEYISINRPEITVPYFNF